MKKALLALAGALVALCLVLVVRAARLHPDQIAVEQVHTRTVDTALAAQHLGAALRIRTISTADTLHPPIEALQQFHAFLAATYPQAHAVLQREVIGGTSLLYTWRGTDSALAPAVLMGHMDVVPVVPGTDSVWTHPPFSGDVADGFIWGRGALDDKVNVIGVMEAVEMLAASGVRPRRTLYLAFGGDEEVGGHGAEHIVDTLSARGVHPAFVIDEGGGVMQGAVPGVAAPVALVGIAEKGYMSVELVAHAAGGHSSMPPQDNAVALLSRAITRIEADQMPPHLSGPAEAMFGALAPEMAFRERLIFANQWLFRPLLVRALARSPSTNAMIRTTTAPTMLEGSPKDNVLPITARAVVNFRVLPGDNTAEVLTHLQGVIADGRVTVRPLGIRAEPSPVSPTDTPEYRALVRTIRELFPGVVEAPYLVVGATDSRHYARLTTSVYRFTPVVLGADDLERIHGTNERLGVSQFGEAVRFYARLIETL